MVALLLFSTMHFLSGYVTKKMMVIEPVHQKTLQEYAKRAGDLLAIEHEPGLLSLLQEVNDNHQSWAGVLHYERGLIKVAPIPLHLATNFGFPRKITWPVHAFLASALIGIPLNQSGDMLILELPQPMYPNKQTASWLHYALTLYLPSFILMVFCWGLYRYLMHPLEALNRGALTIASGDLSMRIPHAIAGKKNELGEVANSFNSMAKRVEKLVLSHRQMLGDLSHELRTPLTRMELALQEGSGAGANEDFTSRLRYELQQMNELVEDALTLAWLDSDPDLKCVESLNLSVLLDLICDDAEFEFPSLTIERVYRSDCHIQNTNQRVLSQCIENVLRNALKYSPSGGTVRVACEQSEGVYTLKVMDEGCGVPEGLCEQIFDPFFRVDQAEQRKGFGLGLALSKRQIQGVGGDIHASNHPDGGLIMTLIIPNTRD